MAWVTNELALVTALAAMLALVLAVPAARTESELEGLRLVLDTTVAFLAVVVSVLAFVRLSVERRRFDLFLACGFSVVALATLVFAVGPTFSGGPPSAPEAWAGVFGRLVGGFLLAAAPFVRGTVARRETTASVVSLVLLGAGVWIGCRAVGETLPVPTAEQSYLLTGTLALQALLSLLALVGFGLRFRAYGEDLDRWLAFGATIGLFAELHTVFTPPVSAASVSQADFLRLLGYGILLAGVWRAIRAAEFGRAVAEERARVAREIHDGLAQYLFAITAHTSRLENGAAVDDVLPVLREAATLAQQEARFAVLALSSAGGSAPFDAALNRYVEFLTADGALEVDLEIAPDARLGPDEQIEVFRIVQEGLANVRRHAGASRAVVHIGVRDGQRIVSIVDDGRGLDADAQTKGQGLRNMRTRAASIGGGFRLLTQPGGGTMLEVTLRA